MSPFELCSCCCCHVFSYNFAQFFLLKRVKCPPFFVFATKTTQTHPQVSSVNGALTCLQVSPKSFVISDFRDQSCHKFRTRFWATIKEKFFQTILIGKMMKPTFFLFNLCYKNHPLFNLCYFFILISIIYDKKHNSLFNFCYVLKKYFFQAFITIILTTWINQG